MNKKNYYREAWIDGFLHTFLVEVKYLPPTKTSGSRMRCKTSQRNRESNEFQPIREDTFGFSHSAPDAFIHASLQAIASIGS